MAAEYTDSHSHLLPGIDDGSGSYDESLEMAAALAAVGFGTVWCTPHRITGAYDTDPALIREHVVELQRRLTQAGIPLTVAPATEYYFDEFLLSALSHPLPLHGTQVLVEFPPSTIPEMVPDVLFQVIRSGLTPLVAHPERSSIFALPDGPSAGSDFSLVSFLRTLVTGKRREAEPVEESPLPPLLNQLRSMGCRFQGNIGSFAGIYGTAVRETALLFLREGAYDCLGSDAHRPNGLESWVTEGLGVVEETVGPAGLRRLLRGEQRRPATP